MITNSSRVSKKYYAPGISNDDVTKPYYTDVTTHAIFASGYHGIYNSEVCYNKEHFDTKTLLRRVKCSFVLLSITRTPQRRGALWCTALAALRRQSRGRNVGLGGGKRVQLGEKMSVADNHRQHRER